MQNINRNKITTEHFSVSWGDRVRLLKPFFSFKQMNTLQLCFFFNMQKNSGEDDTLT